MPAELLHRERLDFDDGAVKEMVLWRVPEPDAGLPALVQVPVIFRDGG